MEDGPALPKGRHSVRRSWMTKVFSPVVGYSEDFRLLHFVHDLTLWSNLGGCKNATRGMPLRLAVKGSPIFPEYWRVRHQGLIDMQRQTGAPALFRTRAPYERSFPYHQWVLHEMALAGRGRLNLAGPETLHMAHVLKEMDRGLFAGKNHEGWSNHLLGAEETSDGEERPNTVINFCSRLEFQDGKRRPKGQQYHGRGTVHSHSLDFLENKAAAASGDRPRLAARPLPQPGRHPRGAVDLGRRGGASSAAAPGERLPQAHSGLLPGVDGSDQVPRGRPDGGRQTQPAPLRGHLRAQVQRVFREGLVERRRFRLQRCPASCVRLPPPGARDVAHFGGAALPTDQLRGNTQADRRALPRHGREAELR